jgi:hypothetical protein
MHRYESGGRGSNPFRVTQNKDFSYTLCSSEGCLSFREVCPKDFYFFAFLEEEVTNEVEKTFRVMELLAHDFNRVLTLRQDRFWVLVQKVFDYCVKGKVMTPNQWLETAFHLCKQRWDESIEWMETLPMSKVNTMIEIQFKFAEEMQKDVKDRSRRSRSV